MPSLLMGSTWLCSTAAQACWSRALGLLVSLLLRNPDACKAAVGCGCVDTSGGHGRRRVREGLRRQPVGRAVGAAPGVGNYLGLPASSGTQLRVPFLCSC